MSKPSSIVSRIFGVTSWLFYTPAILCVIGAIVTTVWMLIYASGAGANSGAGGVWTYLFGMMFGGAGAALALVGFILGFIGKATAKKKAAA